MSLPLPPDVPAHRSNGKRVPLTMGDIAMLSAFGAVLTAIMLSWGSLKSDVRDLKTTTDLRIQQIAEDAIRTREDVKALYDYLRYPYKMLPKQQPQEPQDK